MNRRELVQKIVLGGGVMIIVPSVLESCNKDSSTNPGGNPQPTEINLDLSLAENAALNNIGGSKIIQNVLVVNLGGSFIALSSVCTHQGCTVGYNSTAGNIQCPCHGSVYSTTGSVINGPAPNPLRSYSHNLMGTVLTITL
jgi:cytochrome b6-f complex iron-sulfur subunit